jgi:hypothetical protein
MCESCEVAELLREFEDPDESLYHCYHKDCKCGCYKFKLPSEQDLNNKQISQVNEEAQDNL